MSAELREAIASARMFDGLDSAFPVPSIAMQLRTGVAMLSDAEDTFFGILSDYGAVAISTHWPRESKSSDAKPLCGKRFWLP